jgi:RND family efflux transporter MFP subunit
MAREAAQETRWRISAAALIAIVMTGCGEPASTVAAGDWPQVATLEVRPELLDLERRLDGTVEAVNQATVSAQTSGRVAEILYDVNDFVPANAVIIRLRGQEQRASLDQAQAALREAQARATEAQTHHRRIADVFDRGVVPRATLDEAQAARDSANARVAAAEAAVVAAREGVSYTEIRAPYAGVVTRRHVEVGESVSPGKALMSGLSLQHLRVVVDIPQTMIEPVRELRRAAVYIPDGDGQEQRIEAKDLVIFPVVTAPANTFRARVDLPENAAALYPGMFVKVGLAVGRAERLLVPVSAMVERGELRAVYVVGADGHIRLRQLRTGHRFGERIEVLAGLAPGERIATDPVAAGAAIAASPAGGPTAADHE